MATTVEDINTAVISTKVLLQEVLTKAQDLSKFLGEVEDSTSAANQFSSTIGADDFETIMAAKYVTLATALETAVDDLIAQE